MAGRALFALALVAMLAAASAQTIGKTLGSTAGPGRVCHISCYNAGNCQAALAVKRSLLKSFNTPAGTAPFVIEKESCNINGCGAIVLYSFASEDTYKAYQAAEKTGSLFARYTAAGLKSATPQGLQKSGPCDTLVRWY